MTIKNIFRIIFGIASLFSLLTFLITINLSSSQQQSIEAADKRLSSHRLAQEVTFDSDALTRLARTYVVTLDPQYKAQYFNVADKIEGKQPRPDGSTIAFRDLLVNNDFTQKELVLLDESVGLSLDLITIEEQAFSLVEPFEGRTPEQLSETELIQWQQALTLLFNQKYHQERTKIFSPVSQFMEMLENRTFNSSQKVNDKVNYLT